MSTEVIVTLVCAIFASSGFWAFITARFQSKDKRHIEEDKQMKAQSKMLKGLGHDRIISLGTYFINRGYITADEYENLRDYLYEPYVELGGNGTAEKVMKDVAKLPIHDHPAKKEVTQ